MKVSRQTIRFDKPIQCAVFKASKRMFRGNVNKMVNTWIRERLALEGYEIEPESVEIRAADAADEFINDFGGEKLISLINSARIGGLL